jgi:hypothetical protein
MKRRTTLFFFVCICFVLTLGGNINAQPVVSGEQFENDSVQFISTIPGPVVLPSSELNKPEVSLSMGTSFSSFGSGFSGLGTYVAPTITLPVNNKFSVSFGLGYSSFFFNTPAEASLQSANNSYGSIFVSGAYQVNENLVIRGTAYKTFLLNTSTTNNSINPAFYDMGSQGFSFDAEYKVNDKFRIGVSVEYRDMNQSPYYPNINSGCGAPTIGPTTGPISPFSFSN